MTEQELRDLVRQAIANHASGSPVPLHPPSPGLRGTGPRTLAPSHHSSHLLFLLPESDGPCPVDAAVVGIIDTVDVAAGD